MIVPALSPFTRVYSADTASLEEDAVFAVAYGAVSQTRREKTDRLRFRKDQCLSLGVELLLMRACRDAGIDYARERIVPNGQGKPVFSHTALHFNLSHSGSRVLCALSDLPVGCDVETLSAYAPGLADRFFHPDEAAALRARKTEAEKADLFCRLWTLKESFIKCTGEGLRTPLNTFCVSLGPDGVSLSQSYDDGLYRLYELGRGDDYRYAICVRLTDDTTPDIRWTHLDTLIPPQ